MHTEIVTKNTYLRTALLDILQPVTSVCKAQIVILNLTNHSVMDYLRQCEHNSICAAVLIFKNNSGISVMHHVVFPYPVVYITLGQTVDDIKEAVNIFITSLAKKTACRYQVQVNNEPRRWLTPREFEVLSQYVDGRQASVISERLNLSVKTIYNHVGNSMKKLGISWSQSNYILVIASMLLLYSFCRIHLHAEGFCILRVQYMKSTTPVCIHSHSGVDETPVRWADVGAIPENLPALT